VLPRFFIDRPIFAAVISILITLAGGIAAFRLPVSQFPPVTPPTIQVDCNYPGASAEVVSKTIASPLEQRVNGVERMLYMSSQCTNDGSYTLTITFEPGTDLNLAQVLVQNRVNLATPELPEIVRSTGVTVRKRSPELLLTFALMSKSGKYDQVYLSNYAVLHLRENLSRIPGISDVTIFGQRDYSLRIWIKPGQLEARQLTVLDVVGAIRSQNAEVAMGNVNPEPREFTITSLGRLDTVEQFENIIVKTGPDGQLVHLREVARVELAAKSSDITNRFDSQQTVGLAIFLTPDANAITTSKELKDSMADLGRALPPGMEYEIGYDTTPYIESSIFKVGEAMRDSILLVGIVVLIFLQSWRSALIPLATVPVAIIGTCGAMAIVGFGLNNLTLFGLVLAVGIVVDDAIVVVEAVQHHIERGLSPKDATAKAMEEVAGPVIAVGVVLCAVFVPCMFFPGIVGQFFRQFALTIAISTMISTFNSLTLSPALAALLLQSKDAKPDWITRAMQFCFGWFFRAFNWSFDRLGRGYTGLVGKLIRIPLVVLVLYAALVGLGYRGYTRLPTGFIPAQDKGYLIASVQLPDAASAERTRDVMDRAAKIALECTIAIPANEGDEGAERLDQEALEKIDRGTPLRPGWYRKVKPVAHVNAVAGNSFVLSAYGSNFGSMFVILKPFAERSAPQLYSELIAQNLRKKMGGAVPEAQINIFGAPAVPGLGRAGGIKFMVQDRGEVGPQSLQAQTMNLIEKGNKQPSMVGLFTVYNTSSPQLAVTVDEAKCSDAGVEPLDVYATMQSTLGQRYVNDLNLFGRTWQVNVQSEPGTRNAVEDAKRLRVRSKSGTLVPLNTLVQIKPSSGPLVITRYNMYPAAAINASIAPGASSGEATAVMEQLAKSELPSNMGSEWTELTFIEQRSRDTGMAVFALAVLVVFLVLAALYESWTLPLAVILVVPTCVACSLAGVWITNWDTIVAGDFTIGAFGRDINPLTWIGILKPGVTYGVNISGTVGLNKQDVNLFTQVGFVVLIGLACKNAILIVEYAKKRRDAGDDRRTAILEACRLRLRPILMTSFAFILGVVPLAFASGAGAEMRQALGIAVFSGMIGVTIFGVLLTPVFYVVVDRLASGRVGQSRYLSSLGTGFANIVKLRWPRRAAVWLWSKAAAQIAARKPFVSGS